MSDKRAVRVASKLCQLLMRLRRQSDSIHPGPYDDFAFGSAVSKWERRGKKPKDFFSTDDPAILEFKERITLEFGLLVMTHVEAKKRKLLRPTVTEVVTEATWLNDLGIVNPFEETKED